MTSQMPLRLERVGYTHPDAARLVADVQAEYVLRYGTPDEAPVVQDMFDLQSGSFYVGYLGDEPVATGAWKRRSDVMAFGTRNVAEIKRMYVVIPVRGQGLARLVLTHLESTAIAAGIEALVLETGTAQPEAITLYESSGYLAIPDFGHYAGDPMVRSFGKLLVGG